MFQEVTLGDAETWPPVMELIDRIEEFVGEHSQTKTGPGNDLVVDPQRSVPTPASMQNRLVDRHRGGSRIRKGGGTPK